MKRNFTATAILALFLVSQAAFAQDKQESKIPAEYESVVSTVQRVIGLLSDVTLRHASDPISDQILSINDRLTMSGPVTGGFRFSSDSDEDLIQMLRDVQRELRSISRSLERQGDEEMADRLNDVMDDMDEAISKAGNDVRIRRDSDDRYEISNKTNRVRISTTDDDWWDSGNTWESRDKRKSIFKRDKDNDRDFDRDRNYDTDDDENGYEDEDDSESWKNKWDERKKPRKWDAGKFRIPHNSRTFVGEFTQRWPYREYGLYRNIPSIRYNRVEGLFLGIGRRPLEWSDSDRGRIFGQAGYGFGTEDWSYEIGAESRLGGGGRSNDFDVKIGGSFHRNTSTNDLWKSSWAENSAAAILFEHDFFDYHQTEGWTGYVVSRITPYAQLSVGYRADEYTSLSKVTAWSLFGNSEFRPNPGIVEGNMRSIVLALEGGQVRSFDQKPSGGAFRFEAEIGQGLGGDFDFSRYVGDIRGYAKLSRVTGLNVRVRGGFTEGTVPIQKAFTLGGVGSVRAYNQNVFLGTRMLLANAELALYQSGHGMSVLGLFDAGWTNSSGKNEFSMDDVIPAAGFGVSFDDRAFRLEVAWPLKNMGTGMEPSVWVRIAPTF